MTGHRPRRRVCRSFDHGQPIGRIDTLPILILCMCLACMFLATWKVPDHALTIGFPVIDPTMANDGIVPVHRVAVKPDGTVTLDGTPTDRAGLSETLQRLALATPAPGLVFEPSSDAGYDDALHTLAIIASAGLAEEQFCFGGLSEHRDFGADWSGEPMYFSIPVLEIREPERSRATVPPRQSLPECDPGRIVHRLD